jgi:hypothetical protein
MKVFFSCYTSGSPEHLGAHPTSSRMIAVGFLRGSFCDRIVKADHSLQFDDEVKIRGVMPPCHPQVFMARCLNESLCVLH